MTQADILNIIRELGGQATLSQVVEEARKRNIYNYENNRLGTKRAVSIKLRQLHKWGELEHRSPLWWIKK